MRRLWRETVAGKVVYFTLSLQLRQLELQEAEPKYFIEKVAESVVAKLRKLLGGFSHQGSEGTPTTVFS